MAEIRIWNKKMPLEYIKQNCKAPLPILSETKTKLKMNINKRIKKNKVRENRIFEFGGKKNIKIDENIKQKENGNDNNENNFSGENNFGNDYPEYGNSAFDLPGEEMVIENNPDLPVNPENNFEFEN